ncbi:MAG: DoxX family protein, partial [bacterium]
SLSFSDGVDLVGTMDLIRIVLQVVVGLVILNVWLLRANESTGYRGGEAKSLKEEFATYGLPVWFFYLVGVLKICCALALLAGVWFHFLVIPGAVGLAVLMAGAFTMHLKVKDPFKKAWPSLAMLALSLLIAAL